MDEYEHFRITTSSYSVQKGRIQHPAYLVSRPLIKQCKSATVGSGEQPGSLFSAVASPFMNETFHERAANKSTSVQACRARSYLQQSKAPVNLFQRSL